MTGHRYYGCYPPAGDPHQENTVSTPTPTTASTPEPVLKAAALWGTLSTFIVAAVGMLVTFNVLSPDYAALAYGTVDYVNANLVGTGTTVAGLVGIVSGLVSPWVTALVARRKVTPVVEAPVRTVIDGPKAGEL